MAKPYYPRRTNQEDYDDKVYSKRKKLKEDMLDDDEWDEDRMDIIGANGNVGYQLEDM
jgi:hypothetical protein